MGKYWINKTDNVDTVSAEDFNTAFDSIEADIQTIEGSFEDTSQFVKKTDYATASSPGVVTLTYSGNPGNNPAVMTEDAVGEYLDKNNYIKQQEVPGALTAGKYIDISSDGKITAKAINNYGTPSDMTDFSDSVLLTPNNMPEMMAITIVSNDFKTFMTDARKDAALQNLGAAKESVIDDALALDEDGYVTAIKGHALYPSIEGVEL